VSSGRASFVALAETAKKLVEPPPGNRGDLWVGELQALRFADGQRSGNGTAAQRAREADRVRHGAGDGRRLGLSWNVPQIGDEPL
jgi:hypothetical protein